MAVLASAVMPRFILLARCALTVLVLCVSQQVTAAAAPSSDYLLTVSKNGSGTVMSSPAGINCGTACSAIYASGTSVTLTATAASGYSFAGWSGACRGKKPSCRVSMKAARNVGATFTQNSATNTTTSYSLNVSVSGSGNVTSSPGGINCGTTCTASYASGTSVTLTATAATGYSFAGWSGACSGTSTTCAVAMTAGRGVTATFSQNVVNYTLTVGKSGSGSITSAPAGINCGTTCSASYSSGTSVTLTAGAASGYSFAGWGGACSDTSETCTVSMSAARSVTATFNQILSNAATLVWDPPAAGTNPAGYRLYFGGAPGTYQQPYGQGISVGNVTTYTLLGLSSGTYYFAVTAVDSLGKESAYSNEAFKDIP
ncbi:MAG: InlB B-repeat-containing protein [Pseudomonadota bacterium]